MRAVWVPKRRSTRGATALEVLITGAVLVPVLLGLIALNVSAASSWARGSSRIAVDTDASLALQEVAREVRAASSAWTDTGGAALNVILPAVNREGDFDRTAAGDTVRYYISGGALCRSVNQTDTQQIARGVASLHVVVSGTQTSIQLTSRRSSGDLSASRTLGTQVTLRNENIH